MKTQQLLLVPFFTVLSLAATVSAQEKEEPKSGTVTVSVGDVQLIPAGGDAATPIKAGDKVDVGATVKTGAQSRAVIVITPRSAIRISENSEVLIAQVDETVSPKKVLVDIKSGGLGALLKPGASEQLDFQVKTPSGVAAARGTFFAVVVEDGKGYAQVKEGRIEIIPEKGQQ